MKLINVYYDSWPHIVYLCAINLVMDTVAKIFLVKNQTYYSLNHTFMRKLLLLSLLTLFASVTALADVAAFIPKGSTMYKGTAPDDKKVTLPDGTLFSDKTDGNLSSLFTIEGVVSMQVKEHNLQNISQVTSGTLRVYIGDEIIFTPADGVTITKISVKCTTNLGGTITTSWGTTTSTTAAATPFTWEPATDGSSQPESFNLIGTKQIRAQYIEIEYTASSQPGNTVTAPVITLLENNTVEITQEDGDDIYYTTDATEPTTASTPYAGTFTISGVTTVKAVAVNNDGEYSKVVTKTLTPNVINSIAEFISYKPSAATRINTPVTVIYKNGRNMYLKDADDSFILAYNTNNLAAVTDLTAVNGDQLSSITGTYYSQSGLHQLIPTAIGEKTSGTAVEPYEVNVADIDATMLNQYVKFGPVKIEAQIKANNYTATDDEGNNITIYNTFYNSTYYDVVTVEEGEGFTVTGFVGVYNNTVQITPIALEGGTVIETVATPVFSVASGAVEEGTSVEITCATDGATIYYTDDNTTPSATNGYTYTGTPISITDAVTIKAIAVLDGWYDSEIATASYSILQEGAGVATFVFTDEANGFNLTPAIELPTASKTSISMADESFTNGSVTITFSLGGNTNGNKPVLLYPTAAATKGQIEGRIYVNNTIAFSCPGGVITKVTFDQWSNSTDWAGFTTASEGFDAITATDRTFTSPAGVSTFVLNSTKTSRFKSITVDYVVDDPAGIEDIVVDPDSDEPVEFYNVYGIRVDASNLVPGIYICRQGSKATKVYVK